MKFLQKEYRVVLPLTLDEYKVGQLWSVAETSKHETGGGEGVKVIENRPFEEGDKKGQYTKKIFHLESRVPKFLKLLVPKGSMDILEESWNAFPHCKTVLTNPRYMGVNFEICIETIHLCDLGESENVHKLSKKDWEETEVVLIDIAKNEDVQKCDYSVETDPTLFKSAKTDRAPLDPDWLKKLKEDRIGFSTGSNSSTPPIYMCAYKLVSCRFKWLGLQTRVENFIHKIERRLFMKFHRQMFCWLDNWHGMTMDEIRDVEEKAKEDLDSMIQKGGIKGTTVETDTN